MSCPEGPRHSIRELDRLGSWLRLVVSSVMLGSALACSSEPGVDGGLESDASNLVDASLPFDAETPPLDAGAFATAPHRPLPIIPRQGGPIIAHPHLITVTFDGYVFARDVQRFGDFIVGSAWLSTVGREYGLGLGTHAAPVVLQEPAPATMTARGVTAMLSRLVQAGTLPAPTADTIYALYFPRETTVDPFPGAGGCASGGAFHASASLGADLPIAVYAVIPDCTWHDASQATFPDLAPLEIIEETASHEILEAMSDPLYAAVPPDPAFLLSDPQDPWSMLGGEIVDWCVGRTTREAGFVVTRVYSNEAAAAGANPCIPAPPGPYFNVSPEAPKVILLGAGESLDVPLRGWSTEAMDAWALRLYAPPLFGGFDAHPRLSAGTIGNGETVVLSVSSPVSATRGARALLIVASVRGDEAGFNPWPLLIEVR